MKSEDLHRLAFEVTPDIILAYPHMIELWRMVLGGFVLPELAKSEPDILTNEGYRDLIKMYDKDAITKFFARESTIVEVEVERIVEVPVIVEKTTVLSGEKVTHRRIRSDVDKVSRKVRGLTPRERDIVIQVFNSTQDMIDKTSGVFKTLVDKFNEGHEESDQISASQLGGYWSSLCRWADQTAEYRNKWIRKCIEKGIYNLEPVYTPEFIEKIKTHYKLSREEDEARRRDHSEIKAGRKPTAKTVVVTEVKREPTELDSLMSLDLSDLS